MSQTQEILEHLKKGNTITPVEALNWFGCMRLGARVFNLKRQGHNIQTKIVERNGKRFASYFMNKKS